MAIEKHFKFGKNWRRFLSALNDERIAVAERSLKHMLELDTMACRTFLDIGSGSGLFSLVAMRLGARHVHSFDIDSESVACTQELKQRYFPHSEHWTIEQGSVLDVDYLHGLGQWDIVYSWGVLHHTGNMWQSLNEVVQVVAPGGLLFVSIYNDQGLQSVLWKKIKHFYNQGAATKWLTVSVSIPILAIGLLVLDLLRLRNPLSRYVNYEKTRGMSVVRDWIDWLGGYPFEVARPEEIINFYMSRGFNLRKSMICGRKPGCNEFVFCKP